MTTSTNNGLFTTTHTTSDNYSAVSPSDVETVWLDIVVSGGGGEEDNVFVLAIFLIVLQRAIYNLDYMVNLFSNLFLLEYYNSRP